MRKRALSYSIYGQAAQYLWVDLSKEMLQKLIEKQPNAMVVQKNLLEYSSEEKFDYIFITSGSVSLFTDIDLCKQILSKLKMMLAKKGKLVFAVDTVANICRRYRI